MRVTIDKTGRIVVPKPLRDKYNIHAGTELEITGDSNGIRITRFGEESSLQKKNGILIHHGRDKTDIDLISFIQGERQRRSSEILAENPGKEE